MALATASPIPSATLARETAERAIVLVVEDDPFITRMLTAALQRAGFETRSAATGEEALQAVARNTGIGLAFVDCGLPDADGVNVGERLRERVPGLPVVLASGKNLGAAPSLPGADGPAVFVAKPYLPSEVIALIRKLLRAVGRTQTAGGVRMQPAA